MGNDGVIKVKEKDRVVDEVHALLVVEPRHDPEDGREQVIGQIVERLDVP